MKSLIKKAFQIMRAISRSEQEKIQSLEAWPSTRAEQIQLLLTYRSLRDQGVPLPAFEDVELRAFSENGEDGILLFIFALLGTTNKVAVELGCGDGTQCNTANLIINHGWTGLLLDGDPRSIQYANRFYSQHPLTRNWPPQIKQAWITRGNVNELIKSHGISGEIDLLTIDLDGMDYWIWQAIDVIQPRVVMLEIQDVWGASEAMTIPYQDDFDQSQTGYGFDYCGASYAAMVKLAAAKGYRLVGAQSLGYNAFFVRQDLGQKLLPETTPADCLQHPRHRLETPARLARIKDLEWVRV